MKVRAVEPIYYGLTAEDARRYEPGDLLDVSDEVAAQLVSGGAAVQAEPVPEKKGKGK